MKHVVSNPRLGLAFAAVCLIHGLVPTASAALRGYLGIHDPSTPVECNGRYYVFSTGPNISARSSADKKYWVAEPNVFSSPPAWIAGVVPGFVDVFWAPDVIYFNGLYHLYYSCSTFGSQVSAIGLVTNPTLDPNDPSYLWTDQGMVVQSSNGSAYNCIDPGVAFDASGNLWMAFGSFWNGIYMVRLNETTGLLSSTPTLTHLAFNNAPGDPIEASCLFRRGGYYYLFVNWGGCCAGINSTYNIRVGRSTSITGPYLDRNNVDMRLGGGTLFLKTTGKYIGPGHVGILVEGGTNYLFGCHYYDANINGASMYDLRPLTWTGDDWPVFTNDWSAVYRFGMDARDDNGGYYGLLQNGASVRFNPARGAVLNLDGSSQYVSLPNGAANARTFAAVFRWNGGAAWQRLLDFGRSTNIYAFLTPSAATGRIRFAITSSGSGAEQGLDAPAATVVGVWTHVAVTTDGSRGILYVNGAPVATNNSMTLTAPDIAPTSTWFGRSQSSAHPYLNGQISSVRLYGRALSAAEIIAPQPLIAAPAAETHYQPGNSVAFAGSATDFADVPLSVTGLTWTVEYHDSGGASTVLGPLTGVAGGSYTIPASGAQGTNGFHRIVLTATDLLGRSATKSVDVFPGPADADWTAYYSFGNGADDTNGVFDGTLLGGATTAADPIRGPVLNLNGSSQYVGLPSGVGEMRTFAAWVKWNGGNSWQRVFDFGSDTTRYVMLTVRASNGRPRVEIRDDLAGGSRTFTGPVALPVNAWTHLAVTFDGNQGVLFVNGRAVAVNASVNLLPSDVVGAANYLGRSQFLPDDPYFSGQMDSVQIDARCLGIEEITAAPVGISGGATSVTLNWPSWTNGLALHSSSNLGAGVSWTPVAAAPVPSNGVNFLTLTPSNSQTFFRLQLP